MNRDFVPITQIASVHNVLVVHPDVRANTVADLLAPAGTPAAIVNRMHSEIVEVLQAPDLTGKLAAIGAMPVANTPEQFAALIRKEQAQYAAIIKRAGIRVE